MINEMWGFVLAALAGGCDMLVKKKWISQSVLKQTLPNKWHEWENRLRTRKLHLIPAVCRTDKDLGMCQSSKPRQKTKLTLPPSLQTRLVSPAIIGVTELGRGPMICPENTTMLVIPRWWIHRMFVEENLLKKSHVCFSWWENPLGPLLPDVRGLKKGQAKMSKSDPDSAIFMEDAVEDLTVGRGYWWLLVAIGDHLRPRKQDDFGSW